MKHTVELDRDQWDEVIDALEERAIHDCRQIEQMQRRGHKKHANTITWLDGERNKKLDVVDAIKKAIGWVEDFDHPDRSHQWIPNWVEQQRKEG